MQQQSGFLCRMHHITGILYCQGMSNLLNLVLVLNMHHDHEHTLLKTRSPLRNRCRETRAQRFSLRDIRKDPERKVIMAEMRFDQEVIDFPHCPTCHASLVNPINHMVTPTYCDFCWHLSIRDALLRFLAYLGLAWLVSQQVIQFFSWL
jgi:hypothetical protein